MTGRIDWGAYSGEYIEAIIAMFIANEYPWRVEQVQPSQGDGGIDILINFSTGVNVVQVKKFSSSPNSSQKRQIKKSIDRIITDTRVNEYNILQYYIALPSNVTLETKEEISSYGKSKGLQEINWIDLATINGWAAKYPEIIDYYLYGQRDTIKKKAQELAQSFVDLKDKNLFEQFIDFQKLSNNLNKISLHYEYYLSSTPAPKDSTELDKLISERSVKNLVYSQFLINNDTLIILDIVAKHNLSTTMEPIKFSGFFTNIDKNLEDFIKYGSPLNSDADNFILSDKIPHSVV
ncbi:hypothetical protein [uncultured Rothia sp.]|uniref:hypothetical protein n=1 Tax=uncultured Rothia sp. TaxID=316088 RepID=UPI003217E197